MTDSTQINKKERLEICINEKDREKMYLSPEEFDKLISEILRHPEVVKKLSEGSDFKPT